MLLKRYTENAFWSGIKLFFIGNLAWHLVQISKSH